VGTRDPGQVPMRVGLASDFPFFVPGLALSVDCRGANFQERRGLWNIAITDANGMVDRVLFHFPQRANFAVAWRFLS